jgi:hypothetical protein
MMRMTMLLLALVACGGGGEPAATTPAAPAKAEPAAAHLELGEMTVFENDDPRLKVHADGKTEISVAVAPGDPGQPPSSAWQPGPTVRPDGTFVDGEVDKIRVKPDGTFVDLASGASFKLTLTADKVSAMENGREIGLTLSPEGILSRIGEPSSDKVIRVEGATTPGRRRTVLAIMGAVFVARGAESPPPPK